MIHYFTRIGMEGVGLWVERGYWFASEVLSLLIPGDQSAFMTPAEFPAVVRVILKIIIQTMMRVEDGEERTSLWLRTSSLLDIPAPFHPGESNEHLDLPGALGADFSELIPETLPLGLTEGDQEMDFVGQKCHASPWLPISIFLC